MSETNENIENGATDLSTAEKPAYKVADIELAEWGRKEIELAEREICLLYTSPSPRDRG